MDTLSQPHIFDQFPQVVASLTRDVLTPDQAKKLGFDHLILQHQVHGDTINETEPGLIPQTGDALITHAPGYLIGMRVADCATVLVYDPTHPAVAAIHSGWRGTKAQIVPQTIKRLHDQYGSQPSDLWVYVSPLAQVCCYEVQSDFLSNFDPKYIETRDGKHYFDNQAVIRDQLAVAGVPSDHIEFDGRCTMEDPSLRSARRDQSADRMLVAIGIKPSASSAF